MNAVARLQARGLSKTYGQARVLDDVDLVIAPGEIHAVVGQNGSGKSTLVKILTGYHAPDPGGQMAVDGSALELPVQWAQARAAGISVVHQDLGLLDHLSVSENIGVGGYVRSRVMRRINWRAQAEITRRVLDRLDVPLRPETPVAALSAMRRAEVAIARSLRDQEPGRGLVVLDEATRALPREELERFHQLLRRVVADGTSILMVSHNLEEVLTVADTVTVLRDGRVAAGRAATQALTEADLARHMLGRSVEQLERTEGTAATTDVVARVEGLCGAGVSGIDLRIHRGEVVGLTGLPGTGFEHIPKLISGAQRADSGRLITARDDVDLSRAEVADCLRAGVALVPEKRILEGLALELSLRDNIAVPNLRTKGRPWWVGRDWQETQARTAMTALGIRARSTRSLTKELSGGNQQKVLVAKWLSVRPDLLVLHEPTQAVDVGARVDILRTIRQTAADGIGVLLTSIEPSDLVETCDRILVLGRDGSVRELQTDNPEEVLDAVYATEPDAFAQTTTEAP